MEPTSEHSEKSLAIVSMEQPYCTCFAVKLMEVRRR
ncbi:hypothetical protein T11_14590 [Trichinella zimbabwensis]|uniref:Uncharacterized protein n=1 Tax=Trichinella zimbabwensis TaxID=268475 RepID=A0A0V1H6H8_9BILA|nr:hypothetical protein T11_14590 [Trichinella zimbabwensis]